MVLQRLSCGQLEEEVKLRIQTWEESCMPAVNEENLHLKLFGLKSAIFLVQNYRLFSDPTMCSQALNKDS